MTIPKSTKYNEAAHFLIEETEAFLLFYDKPENNFDYVLFLKRFTELYIDLNKQLEIVTNKHAILKFKLDNLVNIKLKNTVLKQIDYLRDQPDKLRTQLISSDMEFLQVLKIIYVVYVLNISWIRGLI